MGRAGGSPAGEGEHQGGEGGDQQGGQGLSNQAISQAGGPAAPNQPAQLDFIGSSGPRAAHWPAKGQQAGVQWLFRAAVERNWQRSESLC
jgi:hypothetical protein